MISFYVTAAWSKVKVADAQKPQVCTQPALKTENRNLLTIREVWKQKLQTMDTKSNNQCHDRGEEESPGVVALGARVPSIPPLPVTSTSSSIGNFVVYDDYYSSPTSKESIIDILQEALDIVEGVELIDTDTTSACIHDAANCEDGNLNAMSLTRAIDTMLQTYTLDNLILSYDTQRSYEQEAQNQEEQEAQDQEETQTDRG